MSQDRIVILRSARKTATLSVSAQGEVIVRAPNYMSDAQILRFLERHEKWISLRKRDSARFTLDLSDGATLILYGKRYTIATSTRSGLRDDVIFLSVEDRVASLKRILRSLARKVMTDMTVRIANEYRFGFHSIRISSARRSWGSCSAKGNISYSFRTAFLTPDEARYIVVHELCHTRHMNHSSDFWKEVGRILPDYALFRKGIRKKSCIMSYL